MSKLDITMEKIVSLCKRRGFVFPGSEIYGGMANSWDYGPYGVELKNNIKERWWETFVKNRSDIVGLDAALIMNPKVWEASGHLKNFTDPLVECKKCHQRYKDSDFFESGDGVNLGDYPEEEWQGKSEEEYQKILKRRIKEKGCRNCGGKEFTSARPFNLMFKTFLGPVESDENIVYLRPETAQGIFVNFKNILDTTRQKIPFGIAQIGKAFRNEITPGNFIFRTREFEQLEIEYFIEEKDWKKYFEAWRKEMVNWMKDLGINVKKEIHELDVPKDERAHYSKKTIDFEYKFPFGQKELYGLAYRTDFDLREHSKFSGQDLSYTDSLTKEKYIPHVIEPSLGVDRTILAILCSAYTEEKVEGETRVVLKFPKWLAPIKVAVFPLLKNKPELVKKAKKIYDILKLQFMCEFDDNGNIGKRYRRQDEIGTPYCVTVDFDSLENGDMTVRDRDTMKQERVKIEGLEKYLKEKLK